ncbi:MAG: hypothetical protein JNJ57_11800, partial [Saprospiraceae bacterium]|nr:hypothetical protein [Saprospiraceae bacterium]
VSIDFVHIGEDVPVMVKIGSEQAKAVLKAGFNKIEMLVPKELSRQERMAEIKIGTNTALKKKFTLEPVRPWEIYLVQHTHTDIGYTRPQTEILAEHLRYIDHALDFCDQTDSYPDDAKFRWTCETAWSVREYLRSRPQSQIDRLLKRIREGRIEATGMFLNYSEIIDEGALVAQTKTLQMLKNMGINVTTAMQNDVNGIAWCMVDYYDHTDVRYLTMGLHAHRAQKPFDKPTAFWWKSPAGNRLLAYRSEHYQHANALSLTTGQQDVFRNNLSQYLDGLEKNGYPYDKISLQFSGYVTDNAPPSTTACDIIRDWNDKYEWPKLRSALVREFMWYLDEQHAKDLPEHQVAWPDWWTDGVGSAANETKTARQAHAQLSMVTALMSLAKIQAIKLPPEMNHEVEKIYDNLLFYDEHTHGAAESVTDPLAQNTVNQWGMKAAYAWEANKQVHILEEKILAFLEPTMPACNQSTIAVYNTLNWPRTGMVELFIQYSVIPEGAVFTILDAENLVVPAQCIEQRMEGAYYNLWVQNIPPLGYKTLKIILGQPPAPEPAINLSFPLENDFYRIEIDTKKGVISQVFDKELNVNLLDEADSLTMGQTIYEQLSNRHDLERLTNTTRDTVYRPLQLSRSVLQSLLIVDQKPGNIYHSIFLKGELPVCADARGVSVEIRLYHFKKMITL